MQNFKGRVNSLDVERNSSKLDYLSDSISVVTSNGF